jgi:hypothetical protein
MQASLISTSAAITNSTLLTAFSKSYSIPAGMLNSAGTVVRIGIGGTFAVTGTPVIVIYVTLGGSAFVWTAFTATSAASGRWTAEVEAIVRTTGATGTVQPGQTNISLFNSSSPGGAAEFSASPLTLNLTAANSVGALAQWGTASASNTISMDSMTIEILPAVNTIA